MESIVKNETKIWSTASPAPTYIRLTARRMLGGRSTVWAAPASGWGGRLSDAHGPGDGGGSSGPPKGSPSSGGVGVVMVPRIRRPFRRAPHAYLMREAPETRVG